MASMNCEGLRYFLPSGPSAACRSNVRLQRPSSFSCGLSPEVRAPAVDLMDEVMVLTGDEAEAILGTGVLL